MNAWQLFRFVSTKTFIDLILSLGLNLIKLLAAYLDD